MSTSVTPFLWFEEGARDAAVFYTSIFDPDAAASVHDDGGPFMGTVQVAGQDLILFEGGPHQAFNQAISLFVSVETQEEVDRLWDALSEGGAPGRCGWLTDRFGVSWQIVPTALGQLMGSGDPERSNAVYEAMMTMGKLDIAGLQSAYDG